MLTYDIIYKRLLFNNNSIDNKKKKNTESEMNSEYGHISPYNMNVYIVMYSKVNLIK